MWVHLKISGNWNEKFILKMYDEEQDSGFDTLKYFLKKNGLPENWKITTQGGKMDIKQLILSKNLSDIPILCHIDQGLGKNGHCVVIADSDEKNLKIHDPGVGANDVTAVSYEEFSKNWTGSFFWIEKIN